jgi:hypothetical protein
MGTWQVCELRRELLVVLDEQKRARKLLDEKVESGDRDSRVVDSAQPARNENDRNIGEVEPSPRVLAARGELLQINTPVEGPEPVAVCTECRNGIQQGRRVGSDQVRTACDDASPELRDVGRDEHIGTPRRGNQRSGAGQDGVERILDQVVRVHKIRTHVTQQPTQPARPACSPHTTRSAGGCFDAYSRVR